jgi:predicted phage-related endonuclease
MMSTVNLDDLRAQVELLKWAKARKAEIADVEATARAAVEAALGDSEAGTVDGELAVTWRTRKVRRLNQKALKEAHPDIVEEFTAPNEQRYFEVY